MASPLQHLIDKNRAWAERVERENPGFFKTLAAQQSPKYLWIGCSDSRVPANQVIGLAPGEVFVHRNVANVVVHSDLNALSVIQFAVDVLKVEHIMVVGHYGCGGVLAVLREQRVGLADHWLRHVHDVKMRHRGRLMHLCNHEQEDTLCEINVIEQVGNIAQSNVLQDAWARGQAVSVHGWCYGLKDGHVKDLGVTMSNSEEVVDVFRNGIKRYPRASGANDVHSDLAL
ncbi:MAG: carbonate dehydratase [Ottowia sp.]|uniref:carbonate dehydratase n=1 Tax=unclassified Ottowia TaxID=2645081 RepID=UPI003C2B2696